MVSQDKRRNRPASILAAFLDVLFPPRCVTCGARGNWLCKHCLATLRPIAPGAYWTPRPLDGLSSVYAFEGPIRDAIHRFKYRRTRHLAPFLGSFLVECYLKGSLPSSSPDLVIPVPLHPRRLAERGYNQSALLAREVAIALDLYLDEKSLSRVRDTSSQMRLPASQRRSNVAAAFVALPDRVQGCRILLVDDVCTTGSTLAECASALKTAGASHVWAITVARAL